ncbi:MAG: hypothetical protein JWN03_5200 [Nocardia sp.]|nr:hypothetical protein [Nocardia sp.]
MGPYSVGDPAGYQRCLRVLMDEMSLYRRTLAELTVDELDHETRCAGWTIRDQIAHLADTDEVAADTVHGGNRSFERVVPAFPSAEAFTAAGCERASDLHLLQLRRWSQEASDRCWTALSACVGSERVRWGFGMSAEHLAMGRTMEYWAHHGDIRAVLDREARYSAEGAACVTELSLQSVRYAMAKARVGYDSHARIRLTLVDDETGDICSFGDTAADEEIRGCLQSWALLAVGRRNPDLEKSFDVEGPNARLLLEHARAYL